LSVRLAADPAGVPGARRFVVEGMTDWGRGDLADAAELVVSEFAGNAALHSGARFMYVTLAPRDERVRIAVEDDGPVPAEVVMPHAPAAVHDAEWGQHATTGRGLAIVSMLAADWGVEVTLRGKRVWAELSEADGANDVRPPIRSDAAVRADGGPELPPGWVLVRLADCPVALSLRQDQHLDELVRELQLLAVHTDNPRSQLIASQISSLLTSPAHARLTGRRIAEEAHAAGLDVVDVEMAMPREFSALIQRLDEAVRRADELCEQDQLLTLQSTPELRELRRWMTHEIVAQADRGSTPTPWATWVSQQVRSDAGRG
jgi:anti-sigma regulatory factor (Ser/Thr protein kinase)